MLGIRSVSKTNGLKHQPKCENCFWQDVDSNKALCLFQIIMVWQNTMITENINMSSKFDDLWDHVEDWLCEMHESYNYKYSSINYRDGTVNSGL